MRRLGWLLVLLLVAALPSAAQIRYTRPGGGGAVTLPATTCTNQFLRALATDGTGDCDAIVAADLPASVLLTTGSYANPAWLTSLAWAKLTGTPTFVNSLTGTANQVIASGSTGDVTLSLPQSMHSAATPTFAGLTLTGGSPGAGKLWTSDGSGVGSWEDAPAGGPGTGTLNTLAFWNTTSTLSSSLLSTDGTNITLSSGTFIGPALKVTGGSPGAGKVLTSDADGDATWQTASVPASEALIPPTTNTSDLGSSSNRFKKSYLTAGLDIAQGTITTDAPAWNSTATWNASGVTFTHLKANITDSASAAASLLLDLQVGGVSKFSVDKGGVVVAPTLQQAGTLLVQTTTASELRLGTNGAARWIVGTGGILYANTNNAMDFGTGSNRARTGYFGTTLDVSQGTRTTDAQALTTTATWNASGVTFTHLKSNITDTASAAASLLLDLQVGGSSKFSVTKAGTTTLGGGQLIIPPGSSTAPGLAFTADTDQGLFWSNASNYLGMVMGGSWRMTFDSFGPLMISLAQLRWSADNPLTNSSTGDLILLRDAADVLAQRRTTNAQTLRVYGTADAAGTFTNYVRASLGSSSTLVTLAAETAGTGADDVSINLTPAGTGTVVMPTVKLTGGSPGANKVLTSDADGDATWATPAGALTWTEVTGTTQQMASQNGYVANNASLVTLTLPTTAVVGEVIEVVGKGAGGWTIAQNASQQIHWRGSSSTVGTGGSVSGTTQYDIITLRCVTANLIWVAL